MAKAMRKSKWRNTERKRFDGFIHPTFCFILL